MLVLDTDVLSILQSGRGPAVERLRSRMRASEEPDAVTVVTFAEQMRGWLARCSAATTPADYVAATRRLRGTFDDFQKRTMLDFGDRAAAEFTRLKAAKVRIGTMDLRIAAITLANDAKLITRNLRDFEKVPGLRAEDWTHGATA